MNNYFKSKIANYIFPMIYCILLIANCQLLKAQNTNPKIYTLEEAVNQALDNNGSIKSAMLQIEYQKKLKKSSWEIGNTNIEYTYGQTNSLVNDNNLTITQPLPNLILNNGQSKLAEANIIYSQIGLTLTQTEIVSEVKSAYFHLAYSLSSLKLLRYQDSLYTNFYRAAELKTQKGESPILEKITAQTQLMKIKSLINQMDADISIYQNKLQVLLNEKATISIADTEIKKAKFAIVDSSAFSTSPILALYQQQVAISNMETKTEKLKLIPEFSLGYFNQSNKDLNADHRFTGIQAGVSVPLLFFSQSAKIQALKINEQIVQNNYDYYKTEVVGEFQALNQMYLKTKSSVEFYEKTALPQSELIIEQSGKSYKAGDINYVEYVLNLDKAIEIKSNYLQALLEYNQAVIEIDKITGKIN